MLSQAILLPNGIYFFSPLEIKKPYITSKNNSFLKIAYQ
jgi:hypothetical protein